MSGRMMFCVIIGSVVGAFAPVDDELSLFDAIFGPVESHVHGFGSFLLDGVVGVAGGG